jgi:hypothetical protein
MPDARGYLRDLEIEEENTDLNRLAESGVHWRYLKEIKLLNFRMLNTDRLAKQIVGV